jgi:hypothetical protein
MMSACIVAAQAVMMPIALLVGRTADSWGRKPLFLAGFAILPIRAVLYTISSTQRHRSNHRKCGGELLSHQRQQRCIGKMEQHDAEAEDTLLSSDVTVASISSIRPFAQLR